MGLLLQNALQVKENYGYNDKVIDFLLAHKQFDYQYYKAEETSGKHNADISF